MRPFERVVLSCDLNEKFRPFWPIVAKAWAKLFDVEVALALVCSDVSLPATLEDTIKEMRSYGRVVVLPPWHGIPVPNQAKMARYWLAAEYDDSVPTLLNDIDLLPLNRDYVLNLVGNRPSGSLITVGAELYTGPEQGKFTAGYLTTEACVFRALVNPQRMVWSELLDSWRGLRHFDHKEDITSTVHHENPDCFSDESLLRYLLWKHPVPTINRPLFYPYTSQALCRSDWKFDPEKLRDGTYKEAHLLRPYSQHADKIKPLLDYLGI